jgi:hypothetical protein
MRTLLQFIVLIVGGVLMLSGCASVDDQPIAQIENTASPTTASNPTSQSEDVAESEAVEAQTMSNSFVFYNSHASW